MATIFNDITTQHNPKQVVLISKNNQYYCESQKHPLREVEFKTYVCDSCKRAYMGPLMYR